jgi:hypothetical protein
MCVLQMYVQCSNRFFEVSPNEVENAELMVEDVVSRVLLDLFDEGTVDDVAIQFSSNMRKSLQYCSIQIRARCSCQRFALLPRTKANIKLAVEKNMGSLLRELFGWVNVDNVTLSPAPKDDESDPAFMECI